MGGRGVGERRRVSKGLRDSGCGQRVRAAGAGSESPLGADLAVNNDAARLAVEQIADRGAAAALVYLALGLTRLEHAREGKGAQADGRRHREHLRLLRVDGDDGSLALMRRLLPRTLAVFLELLWRLRLLRLQPRLGLCGSLCDSSLARKLLVGNSEGGGVGAVPLLFGGTRLPRRADLQKARAVGVLHELARRRLVDSRRALLEARLHVLGGRSEDFDAAVTKSVAVGVAVVHPKHGLRLARRTELEEARELTAIAAA